LIDGGVPSHPSSPHDHIDNAIGAFEGETPRTVDLAENNDRVRFVGGITGGG